MNTASNKTFEDLVSLYQQFRDLSTLNKEGYEGSVTRMYKSFLNINNGSPYLTQDFIDEWCRQGENEQATSYRVRLYHIRNFLDFISKRGWGSFSTPTPPKWKRSPEPVIPTEKELMNLFRASDELRVTSSRRNIAFDQKLLVLEMPVILRLLYSSGIRNVELRFLSCGDVDLERGVVHIRRSKGYKERIVVLHETMKSLMMQYDHHISEIIPGRAAFFPDKHGSFHNPHWLCNNFKKLWRKYNTRPHVVSYCLRHIYAIENINSMPKNGYMINEDIIVLSNSMGHESLESTLYYYHLVPQFADIYDELMGDSLNNILPDINFDL